MTLSPEVLGRRTGQLVLTVTAVAGLLCALATVGALAFGIHPVIVRSGSMTPSIQVGSIAFGHDVSASSLEVGDVVTVPLGDTSITHRIVDITPRADGTSVLRLKGDANNVADAQVYTVGSAKRVLFSVPEAGFVVAWLSKAPGSYIIALYVVAMLLLIGRRRERSGKTGGTSEPVAAADLEPVAEDRPEIVEPAKHRRPFAAVTVALVLALGLAVVSGWGQSTWALWSDSASNSGTTLTTATAFSGPTLTCTKGNSIVTMNWTAWPGATGYILHSGAGGATTTTVSSGTLSRVFNTVGQSGTFTVEATTSSGNSPLSNAKDYVVGNGVGNTSCTDA